IVAAVAESSAKTAEKPTKQSSRGSAGTRGKSPPKRRSTGKAANEKLVKAYLAAFHSHDVEGMGERIHEDAIWDVVPLGIMRGRDEVMDFERAVIAALPDLEVITERVVADTGRVAAEWRMRGTFTGAPFQGIEATGRSIELRGFDLFEVERGKIKRNTAYYDGAAFARAIGLLPPQDSGAEKAMTGAFNAATKVRKGIADLRGR
ncbi:MAG: ester cyclase, partial [Thermoleophilaceae bacterium]